VKVLAPLRNSDEVLPLCDAGAHEFYCGLTPPGWEQAFGRASVHRRNPASAGVPCLDDLRRIVALAGSRPVFATLNAPSYPAGAVPLLVEFGRTLLDEVGVAALIVAEWELLLALCEQGFAPRVHVSSLASCRNPGAAAFYRDLGVARVILPRHLTLAEIEATAIPGLEWEVFVLNDGCIFEEGTCSTTHALGTFCLGDRLGGKFGRLDERYEFWKWTQNNCGCQTSRGYTLGPCGLCALPRLARLGVASLKVVGREASLARKVASVRLAAAALDLTARGAPREGIRDAVIALRGAPELCRNAHLCYYPDVWAGDVPAAAPIQPATRGTPTC
jgi:putative protease